MSQSPSRKIHIALPSTGEEEWLALRDPLLSGWLTQGPKVATFESAFAERHRVQNAMAVSSATTGLHLAMLALGVGPGDEVIVPAFTWVSTANCVVYCGATPIFADVDRTTFNLDLDDVVRRISPRTKAVIAVHLFGLCCDIPRLRQLIPPGIAIVEDAACAAGASLGDVPAGGLGQIGVFSFHPRKSVTTGEGGMVTTNDHELAQRVKTLRNHGASISEEERHAGPQPYLLPSFDDLGFNYRMTDLQGAVGVVQLGKLDQFIEERDAWARYLSDALSNLDWLRTPRGQTGSRHAWQAYVTYVDPEKSPLPRNEIMKRLHNKGVATRPGTHSVHMLGYYQQRFGLRPEDFPAARDCDANTMAIPLHNRMTEDDYHYVVDCLHEIRI